MKLNVKQILSAAGGRLVTDNIDMKEFVRGVKTDIESVAYCDLYAAIISDLKNRHSYVEDAIKKGALVVLVENPVSDSIKWLAIRNKCSIIIVDDVVVSLLNIAEYWRKIIKCKFINLITSKECESDRSTAIDNHDSTGISVPFSTNEHNSTTSLSGQSLNNSSDIQLNLIEKVLSDTAKVSLPKNAYSQLKFLDAHQINSVKTALSILEAEPNSKYCVVEIESNDINEINDLLEYSKPNWASCVRDNSGYHIKYQHYYASQWMFVNYSCLADGFSGVEGIKDTGAPIDPKIVLYGAKEYNSQLSNPQVWVEDIVMSHDGCYNFSVHANGFRDFGGNNVEYEVASCRSKIAGQEYILNTCLAVSIAFACNISLHDSVSAINRFTGVQLSEEDEDIDRYTKNLKFKNKQAVLA